jgi:hypothetical protein
MTAISCPMPAGKTLPRRAWRHRTTSAAMLLLSAVAACGNVEFVNETEFYRFQGESFQIEEVSSHRYVPGASQTDQHRGPFDYSYLRVSLPDGSVRQCNSREDCRRIAREFVAARTPPAPAQTAREGGNDGGAQGHAD